MPATGCSAPSRAMTVARPPLGSTNATARATRSSCCWRPVMRTCGGLAAEHENWRWVAGCADYGADGRPTYDDHLVGDGALRHRLQEADHARGGDGEQAHLLRRLHHDLALEVAGDVGEVEQRQQLVGA